MRHILQYAISSLLLLSCLVITAQEKEIIAVKEADSTTVSTSNKLKYGLRVGADVSKLIRTAADKDFSGFEINADFRLTKNLYLAGELGAANKTTANSFLNNTTKGSYLKLGVDYNMFSNYKGMNNMVYSGFRAGFSTFSQTLNSYTVYNVNQFFTPNYTNTTPKTFSGLSAGWVELIMGVKAEVLNNLYIGIQAQLKRTLSNKKPANFDNLYIPGFNKTFDSGKFGVGYTYTVSYLIPIFSKNK